MKHSGAPRRLSAGRIKVVIADLDDTVYDWSSFYIPSFLAMVEEIHRITGVDIETLKRSFKRVHEKHRTTEYAFAIQELDALGKIDHGLSVEQRLEKYQSAIVAFRRSRKQTLHLFPSVRETLATLKGSGIPVVAASDSMMSYVSRRLRQLDVDPLFEAICAPTDHGLPEGLSADTVRKAKEIDVLGRTQHIEVPRSVRKPDVRFIAPILARFGIGPADSLIVGDSLSRDVLLAKRTGAVDVWAEYGQRRDEATYRELLKITYWTDAEVEEETALKAEVGDTPPSYSINAFSEILEILALN